MANKKLFGSAATAVPKADTMNEAGGFAYSLPPEHVLAQAAATCTFADGYYTTAETQLACVIDTARKVSPEFVAKTAIFSRERGYMKDMPAMLMAILASGSTVAKKLFKKLFSNILNNGRMVRTFVQIIRSGVVGRKSFGSVILKQLKKWFETIPNDVLFRFSVGNDPSIADLIKMVHPKARDAEQDALFSYLIGKPDKSENLPQLVKDYEAFKSWTMHQIGDKPKVPEVPFQMLDSLKLASDDWVEMFKHGSWTFTRMNLNTATRHDVFTERGMTGLIAERLADPKLIDQAKAFPYQLFVAYKMACTTLPRVVVDALHSAMEYATKNVPALEGNVAVCIDTSGSMKTPVTGFREGASSAVSCGQVAALIASIIVRKNKYTTVVPFDTTVHPIYVDGNDTIMTNAAKLALNGGGTDCSVALKWLLNEHKKIDTVIFVSDNMAWFESVGMMQGGSTGMAAAWSMLKRANPKAKLVNINLISAETSQMLDSGNVYQIGGFSDQIFQLISEWLSGATTAHWVETINKISLEVL